VIVLKLPPEIDEFEPGFPAVLFDVCVAPPSPTVIVIVVPTVTD
jgi:hypothetical protein